jgi:hypothetical protein
VRSDGEISPESRVQLLQGLDSSPQTMTDDGDHQRPLGAGLAFVVLLPAACSMRRRGHSNMCMKQNVHPELVILGLYSVEKVSILGALLSTVPRLQTPLGRDVS